MKKYLPIILFALGLVVLIAGFIFLKSRNTPLDEEEAIPEIPFDQRPVVALIPSEDGHWLRLEIKKIVLDAASLDYELLYQLPDGRTQGVPGTVKLGTDTFERDLLLGSESSGKFRYDEGVETGTMTLRFRNEKGKLVGKLSTQFHLQQNTKLLTSVDGDFEYDLLDIPESGYFIVMSTFGINKTASYEINKGPVGVFKSVEIEVPGIVKMEGKIYDLKTGDWIEVEEGKADDVGIFVSVK